MNVVVPAYMKNILICCGYDNCHAIATIEDDDLEYFADEVKKGSVNNFYQGKISVAAIMEGCSASVENFVFSRGHIKLLKAVVITVKNTLDTHGVDGFFINLSKVSTEVHQKENINSKPAPVYRKRFKFSTVNSTSTQETDEKPDDDTISSVRIARSKLIKKAVLILISRTPKLLADVGIFYF